MINSFKKTKLYYLCEDIGYHIIQNGCIDENTEPIIYGIFDTIINKKSLDSSEDIIGIIMLINICKYMNCSNPVILEQIKKIEDNFIQQFINGYATDRSSIPLNYASPRYIEIMEKGNI